MKKKYQRLLATLEMLHEMFTELKKEIDSNYKDIICEGKELSKYTKKQLFDFVLISIAREKAIKELSKTFTSEFRHFTEYNGYTYQYWAKTIQEYMVARSNLKKISDRIESIEDLILYHIPEEIKSEHVVDEFLEKNNHYIK